MKAWSALTGKADSNSTTGSRSLAEVATTTIGNVSIAHISGPHRTHQCACEHSDTFAYVRLRTDIWGDLT
jgi:hypothetical protein